MKKFKKLLSVFISFVIALSSLCIFASAEETLLMGDVDKDGTVSTEDARAVLRMASDIAPADITIADLNGDGLVSVEDAIEVLFEATNIGGVVIPDINGDNFLVDYKMNPDNEFINLIADTYNLDPASLVAIYSVPDSGTNYVLEFGNTGSILRKEYEKSADNLVRVYHIGVAPAREISHTDGKLTNGTHYNCTAAEGWMVFRLVKTEVMAQYPTYFIL